MSDKVEKLERYRQERELDRLRTANANLLETLKAMAEVYPDTPMGLWLGAIDSAITKAEAAGARVCIHCGKPDTTSVCGVGGCPLGADL